ncbi:MAG: hypothetical protein EHM87_14305 [Burkholderiales bacterium]|nr:MAG: hypothetical protein EHM87_14305 [Burkholderiales bacterium]
MQDWDDEDNAPQRIQMCRSIDRAGWTLNVRFGARCIHTPANGNVLIASELEAPDLPLYGSTVTIGEYRVTPWFDADGSWTGEDEEWMGDDEDAIEGAHAWTLTWNPGIVGVTGYRLEPSVSPAPVAVLNLLNALNAEIHS